MTPASENEAATRVGLNTLLLACAITVLLWYVPLASLALYPLRLFVTFIHEGCHALVALLTGGQVTQIIINPDGSGLTWTRGGVEALVVMAGYVGATAYGAGLLALGRQSGAARIALMVSALIVGLLCLIFVRDLFGFVWGIGIAAGLGIAARRLSTRGAEITVMFLGVQCTVNALYDLRTLIGLSAGFGGQVSDAVLMSQIIPLPPLFWAVLWSGLSLGILGLALRPYSKARKAQVL